MVALVSDDRIVCHFVAYSNDAASGGLAETVDRIATHLAAMNDLRVIIYTMGPAFPPHQRMPYKVEDLSCERAHFASPLLTGHADPSPLRLRRLSPEGFQINRLLLLNRIGRSLQERPDDRHVVVSFFLTNLGFTAQMIARELNLPHIACIAGSDLNRDIASPVGMAAATFVLENADRIVVRSSEQASRLERLFKRRGQITIYRGGLPEGRPRGHWIGGACERVSIVSDGGYSFKKSTHSLVEAFSRLREDGQPVTLTIVGNTEPDQTDYWTSAKREWSDRFGDDVSLGEYVSKDEIEEILLHSHVYCLASLGEGNPNGALYAMALGMPVVAPRTSSLADIADPAEDRVSLFRAGDREDLYSCLAKMVAQVRKVLAPVNCERTDALKRELREAEGRDWHVAIVAVARKP